MQGSGFQKDKYFARSWAMLTRDKGWVKPVLVLAIALFVPIVGPLAVLGYALEWVRLTAWNVDSAPKQKDVHVGALIKAGWRGFVVGIGWSIMIWLVGWLLSWLFSWNDGVQGFVSGCWTICTIFIAVIVAVAEVRASIYQDFKAGFRLDRIWEMVRHDFGGIARITGIALLGGLAVCGIGIVILICTMASWIPSIISFGAQASAYSYYSDSYAGYLALQMIISALGGMIPILIIGLYVAYFVALLFSLTEYNACGLWLRQFDVPAWGSSGDPLPAGTILPPPATPVPPAPGAPVAAATAAAPTPATSVTPAPAAPVTPVSAAPVAPAPAAPVTPAPAAPAAPAAAPAPEETVTPIITPEPETPAETVASETPVASVATPASEETVTPVIAPEPEAPAEPTAPEDPAVPADDGGSAN